MHWSSAGAALRAVGIHALLDVLRDPRLTLNDLAQLQAEIGQLARLTLAQLDARERHAAAEAERQSVDLLALERERIPRGFV